MKKYSVVILMIGLVLLTGCRTTEQAKPEPINIKPSMEILFDARPDDNKIDIILEIKSIEDIVYNSAEYLKAWELWETYALSLEEYLLELEKKLSES